MTKFAPPETSGKLIFVSKMTDLNKPQKYRLGKREWGAPNPVVMTDWHLRPSRYDSNSVKLELGNAPIETAKRADAENIAHVTEHRTKFFDDDDIDECDVQAYYKPLVSADDVLRVKLDTRDVMVFKIHPGGAGPPMTPVKPGAVVKGTPVCLDIVDDGIWLNADNQSWGPRWKVRTIYITGEPVVDDDDFVEAD